MRLAYQIVGQKEMNQPSRAARCRRRPLTGFNRQHQQHLTQTRQFKPIQIKSRNFGQPKVLLEWVRLEGRGRDLKGLVAHLASCPIESVKEVSTLDSNVQRLAT